MGLSSSPAPIPPVVPPRREGVSRRGILMILLLVLIIYVAQRISTTPLTVDRPRATAVAPATAVARAGWWCSGQFEKVNDFVEICVTNTRIDN